MSFFNQPNTIARTLKAARNPQYLTADRSAITLLVQFVELSGAELTFVARPDDPEVHGQDIFRRAVAGEFGAVAVYVPPPSEGAGAS